MHVHVCRHICMHVEIRQRTISAVVPQIPSTCFWWGCRFVCFWHGVSHDLELIKQARLAGQLSLPVSPQHWERAHASIPSSFNWVQRLNSGHHGARQVLRLSYLPSLKTQLSLQPEDSAISFFSPKTELSFQPEDLAIPPAQLFSHLLFWQFSLLLKLKVSYTFSFLLFLLCSCSWFFLRQVSLYRSVWPGTCYV